MTAVAVEVGPTCVRGPNGVAGECALAAVECLDDDLALLDEIPVSVTELWTGVLGEAAGTGTDTIILICPTWWPDIWVDRVRAAADGVTTTVEVLRRAPLLAGDSRTPIVEIASDLVMVTHPDGSGIAVANVDGSVAVAEKVRAAVGRSAVAVIDRPPGTDEFLSAAIADVLRANAIEVTVAADVRRVVAAQRAGSGEPRGDPQVRLPHIRNRRGTAILAGLVASAGMCGGFALRGAEPPSRDATWLVEGRVGVMVPDGWPLQRITSGPGSARLRLIAPNNAAALHLTQSTAAGAGLAQTAAALQEALADEPGDVFVDFNPTDVRAGRAAVTYREIRADHDVDWAVVVDGDVRIAIGCQSAPGREDLVRGVCDQAIRSARAVP